MFRANNSFPRSNAWMASRHEQQQQQEGMTTRCAAPFEAGLKKDAADGCGFRGKTTPSAPYVHWSHDAQAAAKNIPEHIAAGRVVLAPTATSVRDAQLWVLDPLIRGGKVPVPLEQTTHTKGRADWLCGKFRRDLSVCCLFHKGRCHAGDRCHQVHVERATLDQLRIQYANVVCCCKACGDSASQCDEAARFFQSQAIRHVASVAITDDAVDGGAATNVVLAVAALANIAYTVGTPELFGSAAAVVKNGIITFGASRVCRLHLKGCCKYGKDCRHLHLCTQFAPSFGVASNVASQDSDVGTRSVEEAKAGSVKNSSSPNDDSRNAAVAVAGAVEAKTAVTTQETVRVARKAADATVPKPLMAPAFLRANYPTLEQGSLRAAMGLDASQLALSQADCVLAPAVPSKAAATTTTAVDDMELTFRPYERIPFDLSPTYITAMRFDEDGSPRSSCPAGQSSTRSSAGRRPAAAIDSPAAFFGFTSAPSP